MPPEWPELPWAGALLAHVTLVLTVGLLLRRLPEPWRTTFADPDFRDDLKPVAENGQTHSSRPPLTFEATLVAQGRTLAFCDVGVSDGDGRLVGRGHAVIAAKPTHTPSRAGSSHRG